MHIYKTSKLPLLKIILLVIAIFQGVVIGFLFLKSPFFISKANKYLAFAIFSLSWSLLKIVFEITEIIEHSPYFKIVEIIDSELFFPAFILLFVFHQVDHPNTPSKWLRWLFVPPLISTFSFLWIYSAEVNEQTFESISIESIISVTFLLISILILLFYIPYVLFKTYKIIQFSKLKKEKKWLTELWLLEVMILIIYMVILLVGPFIIEELSSAMQILALFATIIIYWISYTGVYKLRLLNDQINVRALLNVRKYLNISEFSENHSSAEIVKSIAHKKREIKKPDESNIYYTKLIRLCSDHKIYRDSTLDRDKVAEMLGISPSYVSQLINSISGENFSTYINRYRVEEVQSLILDKEFENYSLLAIGLECGFSSKTTYYNWFKKMTGMTPNTYRKINQ